MAPLMLAPEFIGEEVVMTISWSGLSVFTSNGGGICVCFANTETQSVSVF